MQRLEIARLLTPTKGKPPLLLDDPLAHYDKERMRYGLDSSQKQPRSGRSSFSQKTVISLVRPGTLVRAAK